MTDRRFVTRSSRKAFGEVMPPSMAPPPPPRTFDSVHRIACGQRAIGGLA